MKFSILLQFLLILVLFISCEESKDDPVPDAKNVSITSIQIITMPLTDKGSSWDLDGNADLIFTIENGSSVLFKSNSVVDDVTNEDLPINLQIPAGYQLPLLDQNYGIFLHDYDQTSSDDYIGGVSFNPSNYKSERPDSKTFASSDVQLKISFIWE